MNAQDDTITVDYLREIHDAFNRQDVDAIVAYFADDGVFQLARGPEAHGRRLQGREEIAAFLRARFEAIPDMRWEDYGMTISGNRAAAEWLVTATLPDGRPLELYGCDLYTFRGRRIVKKDTYWKSRDESI